jgi:2-C-methyl-D-erythritol 4-phosphate cytidylyltransferase
MHLTSSLIIESGMGSGNQSVKKCHALLPTAGAGSRLGGDLPKQFKELAGRPMLAYAIEAFMQSPLIESIWIGVSPGFIDNPILKSLDKGNKPIHFLPTGGPTRQETVRNTLAAQLKSGTSPDDWVLVHDAARPGITPELIEKLITSVQGSDVGGLLAVRLADTLKRADLDLAIAGNMPRVEKTIPRDHLWQAQTPQMFGLQDLHDALQNAIRLEADVTDEASAMELIGVKPLLIEGVTRNFKVTHPADWDLMQLLLNSENK